MTSDAHYQTTPVQNVVVYGKVDELPEIGEFQDTGYSVSDIYSDKGAVTQDCRLYAAKMTAKYFETNLEDVAANFEIIIVPFVDIYNDDGRILGRKTNNF